MHIQIKHRLMQSSAVAALGLLMLTTAVHAQSTDVESVTVTGSHIADPDLSSENPVSVVSTRDLQGAGTGNLENALNQLPQVTPSTTSTSNNPSNKGRATLDLYGLGTGRTLVLLDGFRFDGNRSGADVTVIPSILVDSVQVITGGASAAYGTDAEAGAVNFITRKHMDGIEFDAEGGVTDRGDGFNSKIGVIGGGDFSNGHSSVIFALEYQSRDAVYAGTRPWATVPVATTTTPRGTYNPTAGNLPSQAAVNTLFASYGVTSAVSNSASFSFNPDGTLFAPSPIANYRVTSANAVDNEQIINGAYANNPNNGLALQMPQRRYSAYARYNYEVLPDVNVYAMANFTNYVATAILSTPVTSSAFSVPVTNPFIPADFGALLASRPDPTATFLLQKRFDEAGSRRLVNDLTYYQIAVGSDGKIPFRDWTYQIFAGFSTNNDLNKGDNLVSKSAVQTLLNAADGGASLCAGGYNPFGLTSISAACKSYILRDTNSIERYDLEQEEVDVQGSLFALPAGDLRFAAGFTHMKDVQTDIPDTEVSSGDAIGFGFAALAQSRFNSNELYGEFLIPILKDLPLVKSFDANISYRNADYDFLSSNVESYKFDGNWAVNDELRFRGGFQRAVSIPSPGNLVAGHLQNIQSLGTASATGILGDPCDINSSYRKGANANQVRTLCLAQGVPNSLIDSYTFGGTVPFITGGNPNLKPEHASTITAGVVVNGPDDSAWLSTMNVALDWYEIDITGTIGSLSLNQVAQGCYNANGTTNATYSLTNSYCQAITRNTATGQISTAYGLSQNLGALNDSGFDLAFNWSVDTALLGLDDGGSISLNASANYMNYLSSQATVGGTFSQLAGYDQGQIGAAYPKWKGLTRLTYALDPYSATLTWRYIGAMRDGSLIGAPAGSTAISPANMSYFDGQVTWDILPDLEARFIVNNIFDATPPLLTSAQQDNTDPSVYDTLGRRFTIGIRAKL